MKREDAVFLAGLEFLKDRLGNDGTVSTASHTTNIGTWGRNAKQWAEDFCEAFEFEEESGPYSWAGPLSPPRTEAGGPTTGSGFTVAPTECAVAQCKERDDAKCPGKDQCSILSAMHRKWKAGSP